jgi:hypothetical protein
MLFETQIRTGHPASDREILEQLRRLYEPQGHVVHACGLPGGGMHVRVEPCVPANGGPPQGWASPGYPHGER